MQNLNSPAIVHGPLSESELDRRAYIPKGCDAQGRRPEAAEPVTHFCHPDYEPMTIKETVVWWTLAVAPLCGVILLAFVVAYGSEIADLARQVWKVAS